tara:strand:+ start:2434 stop:2715 length:282 start_codon:yes stop_codon:yes gene_type:complete
MRKAFSTNPKLVDWIPSPQQIKTISEARRLLDLVAEEEGDATNALRINTLNVYSYLHPEVTDPKQLVNDAFEFLARKVVRRREQRQGCGSVQP